MHKARCISCDGLYKLFGLMDHKVEQVHTTGDVTWRFSLGVALFILGPIFTVFIPLVLMIDMSAKWKTTVPGLPLRGLFFCMSGSTFWLFDAVRQTE